VGAGDTPQEVRLTVTDGFGERGVLERPSADVQGSDTVMRLLQRNAKVETRFGGGFVQSIGGLSGGRENGRPVDWFYFVNGELARKGAAAVKVRPGDHIWWDRRDWGVTNTVPAVVGSFPEPFLHGPYDRELLPARVECDPELEEQCRTVARNLSRAIGRTVGTSNLPTESGVDSLRVVVGLWPLVRQDRAAIQLERGPAVSGVYARLDRTGRRLDVLDPRGRTVRTLGPGAGLVAAVRHRDEPPTWVITGTDAAGVQAAAAALDKRTLANRFAIAASAGTVTALPVTEAP
jgi:hypothetical protein